MRFQHSSIVIEALAALIHATDNAYKEAWDDYQQVLQCLQESYTPDEVEDMNRKALELVSANVNYSPDVRALINNPCWGLLKGAS